VRAHRIRRTRIKSASLNIDAGSAWCLQPTLLTVKALGVQRRHRDASQKHIQVELRVEAPFKGKD